MNARCTFKRKVCLSPEEEESDDDNEDVSHDVESGLVATPQKPAQAADKERDDDRGQGEQLFRTTKTFRFFSPLYLFFLFFLKKKS